MTIANLYVYLDGNNIVPTDGEEDFVSYNNFIGNCRQKYAAILNKNTNKIIFAELENNVPCSYCAVRGIHSEFFKLYNIKNSVTCTGFSCIFKRIEMLDSVYKLSIFMISLIRYNKINLVYLTYLDKYGKEI